MLPTSNFWHFGNINPRWSNRRRAKCPNLQSFPRYWHSTQANIFKLISSKCPTSCSDSRVKIISCRVDNLCTVYLVEFFPNVSRRESVNLNPCFVIHFSRTVIQRMNVNKKIRHVIVCITKTTHKKNSDIAGPFREKALVNLPLKNSSEPCNTRRGTPPTFLYRCSILPVSTLLLTSFLSTVSNSLILYVPITYRSEMSGFFTHSLNRAAQGDEKTTPKQPINSPGSLFSFRSTRYGMSVQDWASDNVGQCFEWITWVK